jgi:hypothetical protein
MKKIYIFIVFIIIAITQSSASVNSLTKAMLINKEWKFQSVYNSDTSMVVTEMQPFSMIFNSNYSFVAHYNTFELTGTWQFNNDETKILITNQRGDKFVYTIKILNNNELHCELTIYEDAETSATAIFKFKYQIIDY